MGDVMDIVERTAIAKTAMKAIDTITKLRDENERLRTRLDEAEKVIKPFADMAIDFEACPAGDPSRHVPNLGELRAARKWMEDKS